MMQKDDRRMFDRFAVDFSAEINTPTGEESAYAQCRDVSAAGAGLLTQERLVPNKSMEITLGIPDGREPFRGLGRVIWSKKVQESKWRSGLEFKTVDFMGLRRIFATLPQRA